MESLDKPFDVPDCAGSQLTPELSDTELEAVAAGGSKQPSSGGDGGRRNFRPPLLTGFSPNIL